MLRPIGRAAIGAAETAGIRWARGAARAPALAGKTSVAGAPVLEASVMHRRITIDGSLGQRGNFLRCCLFAPASEPLSLLLTSP